MYALLIGIGNDLIVLIFVPNPPAVTRPISLFPSLNENAATAIRYPPRLVVAMPPMQPFE